LPAFDGDKVAVADAADEGSPALQKKQADGKLEISFGVVLELSQAPGRPKGRQADPNPRRRLSTFADGSHDLRHVRLAGRRLRLRLFQVSVFEFFHTHSEVRDIGSESEQERQMIVRTFVSPPHAL